MSPEFTDYYHILGVSPSATQEDITKAFRALARKFHPDVASDKKTAENKFKEINEANEVLSDPDTRRKFDELRAEEAAGVPPQADRVRTADRNGQAGRRGRANTVHFGGTGFSDFFEQYFGGSSGFPSSDDAPTTEERNHQAGRTRGARQGADIQGAIMISLDEVIKGATREISVRRMNELTGETKVETYTVRIPKGIRANQSIRLPGKGSAGANGGRSGDILLRVHYARHPDWSVDGVDLNGTLELTPWEAVLGATLSIVTLDGRVALKIPAGFQQGQKLRLKGKGLPDGNCGFGDLFITASIQVPEQTDSHEQHLWKELAEVSHFNPRGEASRSN